MTTANEGYGAYLKATLELNDLTQKERQELEQALANFESQQPATVKLELTEAELSLLQEFALDHIVSLELKLRNLERSQAVQTQLGDFEAVRRVSDRHARISQLLEIDTALDRKLWKASQLISSHTGSELVEALELHNQKS
jgi:hypothetical protein